MLAKGLAEKLAEAGDDDSDEDADEDYKSGEEEEESEEESESVRGRIIYLARSKTKNPIFQIPCLVGDTSVVRTKNECHTKFWFKKTRNIFSFFSSFHVLAHNSCS